MKHTYTIYCPDGQVYEVSGTNGQKIETAIRNNYPVGSFVEVQDGDEYQLYGLSTGGNGGLSRLGRRSKSIRELGAQWAQESLIAEI